MAKRKHIGLRTKLASALACLLPQEDRDLCRHNKVSAQFILSKFDWDHIILHCHEGTDEWHNITPMIRADHHKKSRKDTAIAAKVKRIRRKNVPPIVTDMEEAIKAQQAYLMKFQWHKPKIQNRPWPKVQRSFLKRQKT